MDHTVKFDSACLPTRWQAGLISMVMEFMLTWQHFKEVADNSEAMMFYVSE